MTKIRATSCGRLFVKYVCFTAVILTIIVIIYLMKNPTPRQKLTRLEKLRKTFVEPFSSMDYTGEKMVHLDLKGAPPKISYYKFLFPLLKDMGATGLLIEYEDMFPYSEPLSNVSALNTYSMADIETINMLAKQSNLKIIPLVQTFGHMEFILKLAEYKQYREVSHYPQVICPSHEHTLDLLSKMIDQVIEAHPGIEFIHIGADEVYYKGVCSKCTNRMAVSGLTKEMLFLEHVKSVASYIKQKYPLLNILMWDDELRNIPLKEIKNAQINHITPVIWHYSKNVYDELNPRMWDSYSEVFSKVWVATAFKGATGSNQYVCDANHYVQNHRSWLSVISENKNRINFEGIMITGWQRYDHFAILCELLPVALPSLAMCLRLVNGHDDSPLAPPMEIAKLLHCEQPYGLIGSAFGTPKCSYLGGNILENVLHLQQLQQEFNQVSEDSVFKGWLTNYNIAHKFSSPHYIEMATESLRRMMTELREIDSNINTAMQKVYDNFTIMEWRETYIEPFEKKLETLWSAREEILSKSEWPRRPFK